MIFVSKRLPILRLSLIIILLLLLVSQIVSKPRTTQAAITTPLQYEVTISASIGEPKLRLYGWGPANSEVNLDGIGITDKTRSGNDGYYEFSSVFLPLPEAMPIDNKFVYPEICLIAIDEFLATTYPTCIPPLPVGNYDYDIGPVNLSPTLVLEKGSLLKGEQVKASGKTTPNTDVQIYLAREETKRSFFNIFTIVKEVFGYYIPVYETKSDENGEFEFNLPAESVDNWKMYAAATIKNAPSPKSNTLSFQILPDYYSLIGLINAILAFLRPDLLLLIIGIQIIVVVLLLLYIWRSSRKRKRRKTKKPPEKTYKAPKGYREIQTQYEEYLKSRSTSREKDKKK